MYLKKQQCIFLEKLRNTYLKLNTFSVRHHDYFNTTPWIETFISVIPVCKRKNKKRETI